MSSATKSNDAMREANVHLVTIKSFDAMREDGKYGYVSPYFTPERFPFTAKEGDQAPLVLVSFDRVISSEDAAKEMKRMGLEPAKTEHLMAYGAQHWQGRPELVVALGSSRVNPDGDRNVPCLSGWGGRRSLNLDDWDDDWSAFCRFLAVRKA